MKFLASLGAALIVAISSIFGFHAQINSPAPHAPLATSTANAASDVTITDLSQVSGPIGATITVTGSGFTSDSVVHFGSGVIEGVTISTDGTKLTFTVPSAMGAYCKPQEPCPSYAVLVLPKEYALSVVNSNGASNTVKFSVVSATSTKQ